jgi:hypothetical protein
MVIRLTLPDARLAALQNKPEQALAELTAAVNWVQRNGGTKQIRAGADGGYSCRSLPAPLRQAFLATG